MLRKMRDMPAQPPRTRQWSDLATTDFATLDLQRAIAVLPLGATEQHGPHLPLSVDANLAHSMVQAATAHLPADLPALFLPVQRIGYSPEHAAFAGTLSLKADTVMRLWTDIAESVLASGVRKLVLFNTHGGNVGLMDVVARDWRARLGMLVYSASWFNLPLLEPDGKDAMERFPAEEQRFGVHGGQIETAMMLALKPRLVRQSRATTSIRPVLPPWVLNSTSLRTPLASTLSAMSLHRRITVSAFRLSVPAKAACSGL